MSQTVSNIVLAHQVADRYAKAKGLSLMPDFKRAHEAMGKGDPKPFFAFAEKVTKVIDPNDDGEFPEWVMALGTAKRNAIFALKEELAFIVGDGRLEDEFEGPTPPDEKRIRYYQYLIERLEKRVRTLELASAVADTSIELKHDSFTVIPVPGVTAAEVKEALEALDIASAWLRKTFPRVLYGRVYLSTSLKSKTKAWYVSQDDTFYIDVRKKVGLKMEVYTIIHELGHRYDHKFLSSDLRKKYTTLSVKGVQEMLLFDQKLRDKIADQCVAMMKAKIQGKRPPPLSEEAVAWLQSPYVPKDPHALTKGFVAGTLSEDDYRKGIAGTKDQELPVGKSAGPLSVTKYGATSPRENFAEGFTYFVLGLKMPEELAAILKEA